MAGTMQTVAAVTAGASTIKSTASKGLEMLSKRISVQGRVDRIQAKQKKKQDKQDLADKKLANREFLREQGSVIQAMSDAFFKVTHLSDTVEEETKKQKKKAEKSDEASDDGPKREKTGGRQKGTKNKEKESSPDVQGEDASSGGMGSTIESAAKVEMLYDERLPVVSESMTELLEIEKQELAIDERREDREIKEARRALEDRRDAKRKPMLAMGAPTLNKKKEGGGVMSAILGLGKKYLMPLLAGVVGIPTAILAVKKMLGLADNADDIAKVGSKIDDAAKAANKAAQAAAKASKTAAQAAAKADDLAKLTTKVDDGVKAATKAANAASKARTTIAATSKADDIARAASNAKNLVNYSDDFARIGTKIDKASKATTTLIKGGVRATNLINYADNFARIPSQITTATSQLAKSSQIVNYADNFAQIPKQITTATSQLAKSSQFAQIPKQITTATSQLAKSSQIVNYADNFAQIPKQITTATSQLAKSSQIVNYTDDFGKLGRGITLGIQRTTAVADGLADGVRATNLGKILTPLQDLTKTVNVGVKATNLGGVSSKIVLVKNAVGGVADSITGVSNVLSSGVKATNIGHLAQTDDLLRMAQNLDNIGGQISKLDNAVTGISKAQQLSNAARATVQTTEAVLDTGTDAAKAASAAEKAAKLNKGAQVGGKFMSRAGNVLAVLDLANKMGQGQGFIEAIGNTGNEIGSMIVGGLDWVSEKVTGGEGMIKEGSWGDSSRALDTSDIMGNESKWQTSYLEQGINKGVAAWTGTDQVANKKVWTEEQEKLAFEAENEDGAVDIGFGKGQVEDLEALSKLSEEKLAALLAYEVWSDKDQEMIQALLKAKTEGVSVNYDDGGWLGGEGVKFGEGGMNAENLLKQPGVQGENIYPMTKEEFDAMTPNVNEQDKYYNNANTPGSIYTHDIHVEKLLRDFMSPSQLAEGNKAVGFDKTATANQVLEQSLVTNTMAAAAAGNGGGTGGTNIVNAPQNIDNSVSQNINRGSSAHSPAMPMGSGMMGISAGRG